jgi:hypothetical protein
VAGVNVAALVIAIIGATTGVAGVVTAVISIRIAGRSATAGDVSAIATKTATEVAQKQLAIESSWLSSGTATATSWSSATRTPLPPWRATS